jgi:hypothetical protein
MIHLLILAVHLLATIAKLMRPGGVRAVVAESLLLKHQLVIGSRARRRAPNLNSFDRFVLGLGSLFVPPSPLYRQRSRPCRRLVTLMRPSHPVRHFWPLRNQRFLCSRLRSALLVNDWECKRV